ncbi:MAG: PLP-dependent aminotransferase family protein [Acetobacteraceae bacterium]
MRRATGPLYLGIADAIGQAITRHELLAGDRLPPQRQVAEALGIDLTTVTRAYAEAHRRGLLDARVGRGTFVRADPATADSGDPRHALVDMSMNLPPQPAEPSLRKLLQDSLAELVRSSDLRTLMTYRSGAGSLRDRVAAGGWLRPVMGEIDPDRILVCAGAQCALTALMTTLTRPGDAVLTDPLTYPGFRALAAQLGLRLVAVRADADGLLPDALEQACLHVQPKAIYCVPTIHNPTTATLPVARRQALAALASRHAVPIVEDDAYGPLPSQPLPAIASLVAGAGYYVSTLSKCLSPGLRTAFVVAPGRMEATRLVEAVRATSLTPSPLLTGLVTRWMEDGSAVALRNAIRQEAAARQGIVRQVLAGMDMAAHPEGLHVWLTLSAQWSRADFTAHLRQRGLALVASDSFAVAMPAPNAVRICIGAAESREALRAALLAVAEAMRMHAPTHLADIV